MEPTTIIAVAGWFAAINAITFATFAWDKYCARRNRWRVPESRLLLLAGLGGWPGAKLAQRWFRHKTSKMPFARQLNTIPAVLLLCIGGAMIAWAAIGGANILGVRSALIETTPEKPPLPRRFGPGS